MITEAQQHAQRNRNSIFVEDGEILSTETHPGQQFIQRIRAPKCAAAGRAGSFVHISCDESLPMRRPLSIMRTGDDWIEVLYKIVGSGLALLSQKQAGDSVSVMGPIGQPFTLDSSRPRALLIGGGVGIPPMVFVADAMQQDDFDWQAKAILGSEIPFPFKTVPSSLSFPGTKSDVSHTMPLMEELGIPARLTSLAGYEGCYEGYVTGLAEDYLNTLTQAELDETLIYTCGPTPMLKAVAALAQQFSLPCQVSLEEFMACAVGGCAGCAVRINTPEGAAMKRVCVDGPVFEAATVDWNAHP